MKRRLITRKQIRAVLVKSDEPSMQIHQVIDELNLDCNYQPFTLCLECNQPLVEKSREQVKDRVPPYVYRTQSQYMECPACHRIYWRGTHWQAMIEKIGGFIQNSGCDNRN